MRNERAGSIRTAHLFSAICIAACSIYDPSLLSSVRPSSSGGELGVETGGAPEKSDSGGASSSAGSSATGGSSRGGATSSATGGNPAAGATVYGTGGDNGGTPTAGGTSSEGGNSPTGGSGGSATSGGTASGGVVSTQGGSTGTGGSTGSAGKNSGGAAGAGSCAGKLFQGLCWYLGPRGQSCDDTCAAYGGVATGSEAFVGTTAQGGSLTECRQLLTLLGVTAAPFLASRDDVGLGCHLYDADPYWLDDPAFTTDASVPEARIVCACR